MVTDSELAEVLAQARATVPEPTLANAADAARASVEAMVAKVRGDARVLRSAGSIRLHGAGVVGNGASLEAVGNVATSFQRVVTSIGASIEGMRSSRGPASASVVRRTKMLLVASPMPGSLQLAVTPAGPPLDETEPDRSAPLGEPVRPLADRSVEALLEVAGEAARIDPNSTDAFAERLGTLGPRVCRALAGFGRALVAGDFAFEATWREPERPVQRSNWKESTADWLVSFMEGRELEAEPERIVGEAVTVSGETSWVIDTVDGRVRVSPAGLSEDEITRVRVHDQVDIEVSSFVRIQPGGETITTREAKRLNSVRSGSL